MKVAHKKYIEPLKDELEYLEDEDLMTLCRWPLQGSAINRVSLRIRPGAFREKSIIEDAVKAAEFGVRPRNTKCRSWKLKYFASVKGTKLWAIGVECWKSAIGLLSQVINDEDYRDVVLRLQSQKIVASIKSA